jgi:hypothetical protein
MRFDNRQVFRLLPLALVLGASLYSIGFWLLGPRPQVSPADYRRAEKIVRKGWAPGDALAVRPWWAARIREYLGDLDFVQVRDLESEDLSRYSRLWVVLLPGEQIELAKYSLEESFEAGDLEIVRYRLPDRAQVKYDFREQLDRAQVRMHQGPSVKPCDRWITNRWICTRRDWNYVGRMVVELGDDPRKVIWAHPSDEGPIEITYQNVPSGNTLLVHTGFTPPAARTPEGAPVTLRVSIDGREVGKVVQDNRNGYFPTRFDISAAGPGSHTVTFAVSTNHAGMRHFCFDAEVRG